MVYQRTVYETAAEFFDACEGGMIPSSVYVVHDGSAPYLSGEGASAFSLGELDWLMLIEEALRRVGSIRVHFT